MFNFQKFAFLFSNKSNIC